MKFQKLPWTVFTVSLFVFTVSGLMPGSLAAEVFELKTGHKVEGDVLKQQGDVLLVDIRDPRELARDGKVPGALHAPRGMLEFWIDPESPYFREVFNEDREFILYHMTTFDTGDGKPGLAIRDNVFPEVIVGLGSIPLAAYATPSTPEVAASLAPYVHECNAILLRNHGVVTYGVSVEEAYLRMEKVEHAAHILLLARLLGGETVLSHDQLQRLAAISPGSYGKSVRVEVPDSVLGPPRAESNAPLPEDEVLAAIRTMIQKGNA